MKVLILFAPKEKTPFRENISEKVVITISDALRDSGFDVEYHEFNISTINILKEKFKPNVVINLVYGFISSDGTLCLSQPETSQIIDSIFNCVVGSYPSVQKTVQDKLLTGEILKQKGYNVPQQIELPDYNDGKLVIGKLRYGSRHNNIRLLRSKVEIESYRVEVKDCIIQEYIPGDEYTVGVYQEQGITSAFNPVKICYTRESDTLMDWSTCQWDYQHDITDKWALKKLATNIFEDLSLKDYARIDIRMKNDKPYVLDVNSLPNLDPEISLFPLSALNDGITFKRLLSILIQSAIFNNERISS